MGDWFSLSDGTASFRFACPPFRLFDVPSSFREDDSPLDCFAVALFFFLTVEEVFRFAGDFFSCPPV